MARVYFCGERMSEVGDLLQIASKEIKYHERTADFLHQALILFPFPKAPVAQAPWILRPSDG